MNKENRLYENYDRKITKNLEERLYSLNLKPKFSDNALSILKKRYFEKNEDGIPRENTEGLFIRVAANIAYPDYFYSNGNEEVAYQTAEKFYKMMINKEFMPNSPTLMNAGRTEQQLAACFVIPLEDNMESILQGIKDTGMIHKSGGGTGFSFSRLRRKNDYVSTTYGKSSGPVSFIEAYDAMTNSVNQGGFRRGANMGMLRIDHPDILEFIHAKENEKDKKYGNFNFSVMVTDEFMNALKKGEYYVLKAPRKGKIYDLKIEDIRRDEKSVKQKIISENERVLVVENNDVIYQNPIKKDVRNRILEVEKKKVGKVDEQGRITLDAKIVFDEIAQMAWKNGEPGIAFIDFINKYNPTPEIGEIESTNPCGEQPLLPYEACNLGSINLGLMVKNRKIDYEKLEKIVKDSVHFLDNVIDMSKYPLPQITKMVHKNRKIGLGIMGWADMLVKLRIPYNSEKAIELAENIMKFIKEKGIEETQRLAEEREPFPNFYRSIYKNEKPRRNATITTIAPTGTISIISEASSGIEPFFEFFYTHKDADGQKREFKNENLIKDLKETGISLDEILHSDKKIQEMDFIPEEIKKIYVTTEDISVDYHVRMQAAFQKYTDNAVSKTINLPNSASVEDVKKAYLLAYELGCKGITVYRDGSREEQVLNKKENLEGKLENKTFYVKAKNRPDILKGETYRKRTGCGNVYITINYEENKGKKEIFEVFLNIGKSGGCATAQNEGIARLVSYLSRLNADPIDVASQLIGIKCNKPVGIGNNQILSCSDAVGKTMLEFLNVPLRNFNQNSVEEYNKINEKIKNDLSNTGGACPICGSPVVIKEGCLGGACTNPACGYSDCG